VDEPRLPVAGRFRDGSRGVDVDRDVVLVARRGHHAGEVDHRLGAGDRVGDGRALERAAHLDHLVAARSEVRDDVAADESGRARNRDPHQDSAFW
jgi:hypothetical protein